MWNPGSVDINFDYLSMDASGYLKQIEVALVGDDYEIKGVSAGFDTYAGGWGGLLETKDYEIMGRMIAKAHKNAGEGALQSWKAAGLLTLALNQDNFIKGFA
jgi:hypothetical protein